MRCDTNTIATIQNCYRKNSNNENNPIIITLNNKQSKINILKARKEIGSLQTRECHIKGRNNDIFVNEHLTTLTGKIFYATRQLKKEKKIRYTWIRDGNVYIRKTETSDKIKIKQLADIEKLDQ